MKQMAIVVALALLCFSSCSQYNEKKVDKQKEHDSIMQAYYHKQDSIKIAKESIKRVTDSLLKIERLDQLKHSIKITSAWLDSPNSAGGVDANVYYKNLSNKTIKYLTWVGHPINAVGDRVNCEIRGYDDFRGRDTGPIKPGHSGGGCWSCAWYNYTAKKLVITEIVIEYMDGSSMLIGYDEIPYVWK